MIDPDTETPEISRKISGSKFADIVPVREHKSKSGSVGNPPL